MDSGTERKPQSADELQEQKSQQGPELVAISEDSFKGVLEYFKTRDAKGFERILKLLGISEGEVTLSEIQKRKCNILLNTLKNVGEPQNIDSRKITKQFDQQINDAKNVFKSNSENLNLALRKLKTTWTSVQEMEQLSQSDLSDMTFLILDNKELDSETNRNEILGIVRDELQSKNNKPEKFESYTYVLVPNFYETPIAGANVFVETLLTDIINNKDRIFSYFVHTDLSGDTPQKVVEGHKFNTSEEKYKYAIFSSLYSLKDDSGKIDDIQLAVADRANLRIPTSMLLQGYLTNERFDVNEAPFGETNFENNHTEISSLEYFDKYNKHIGDKEIDEFGRMKISFPRIKHTPKAGNMYVYIENTYNGWTAKDAANLGDIKVDMYIKRTLAEFIHRNVKGTKVNAGSDKLRQAVDNFFEDLKKRKVIADILKLEVSIEEGSSGNAADTLRIEYDVQVEGQVNATIISNVKGKNRETSLK
ncbi:MAG: hypothetical protein IPK10_08040 [Bacteroidetes bacterium]|nr:hypothetical protein [Bacteroidota bacterium]